MGEYLRVKEIAERIGYDKNRTRDLLCRAEFTKYRIDRKPIRVKFTKEVEIQLRMLIERRMRCYS